MSHFAKVVDGIVTEVIVAEQIFIDTLDDASSWVQTSYNTRGGKHYDPITGEEDDLPPLRKNYAGIGSIYDAERDAFYSPQPYPSWSFVEESCTWNPPLPHPSADGSVVLTGTEQYFEWDEDLYQSDNTQGWVLKTVGE